MILFLSKLSHTRALGRFLQARPTEAKRLWDGLISRVLDVIASIVSPTLVSHDQVVDLAVSLFC